MSAQCHSLEGGLLYSSALVDTMHYVSFSVWVGLHYRYKRMRCEGHDKPLMSDKVGLRSSRCLMMAYSSDQRQ